MRSATRTSNVALAPAPQNTRAFKILLLSALSPLHAFPAKRQGSSAGKLHVKDAKSLPLKSQSIKQEISLGVDRAQPVFALTSSFVDY